MAIPVEVIQEAQKRLDRECIKGVLVGTLALEMRGFLRPGRGADIDFLVERLPFPTAAEEIEIYKRSRGSAQRCLTTLVKGYKVDYIDIHQGKAFDLGGSVAQFLTPNPDLIDGIPVASVEDIIGLKRYGDRAKDRQFLSGWDRAMNLLGAL